MAKLLFLDDAGESHELKLATISSKGLKEGDVVIANYEVGDAAPAKVPEALTNLHRMLVNSFPKGVQVLVMATRHGKKDVDLKIVRDETKADSE